MQRTKVRLVEMEPAERLFRHRKRPSWGVGLWVREERTRRRVRFEDGQLRVFKEGYYELLKPVDPDKVDVDEVYEQLVGEQEMVRRLELRAAARQEHPPVMSLTDQIAVFKTLFPGGFQGEEYTEAYRTREGKSLTKSHMNRAVKAAQKRLKKKRMREHMDAGQHAEIIDDMVKVLKATKLATPKKTWKALQEVDAGDHAQLTEALFDLLHGDDRYTRRFDRWLAALLQAGMEPGWRMATILPAMYEPEKRMLVRKRTVELQAREVQPGMLVGKVPSATGYRRAKRVFKPVEKALKEAGMKPRDKLDVAMFMWETLRPTGQKTLEELEG